MKYLLSLLLVFATSVSFGRAVTLTTLQSDVTSTGTSSTVFPSGSKKTFHAEGEVSASTGSATILIQASNQYNETTKACSNFVTVATISLSLTTTTVADLAALDSPARCWRSNVSAITGTDASVSVYMGVQPE